jgi:SagB-type dehydrogenase family enzyme
MKTKKEVKTNNNRKEYFMRRLTKYCCLFVVMLTFVLTAYVNAEQEENMSIGRRFHYETSFGDQGYKGKDIGWGGQVPLYKEYESASKVKLPTPDFEGLSVEEAIRKRRSERYFADKPMTLEQLAQMLLSAGGITYSSNGWDFRAAPSGGALYPMEIYVIALNVGTLANGLYHFQVSDNTLELIKEGDFGRQIHKASNEQEAVGTSPVTLILTARFDRSTVKYGDRGYRYIYIEAGAICENIYLEATSLGLGTVAVGAFHDDALNRLLEIDGINEAALLVMPVGIPR